MVGPTEQTPLVKGDPHGDHLVDRMLGREVVAADDLPAAPIDDEIDPARPVGRRRLGRPPSLPLRRRGEDDRGVELQRRDGGSDDINRSKVGSCELHPGTPSSPATMTAMSSMLAPPGGAAGPGRFAPPAVVGPPLTGDRGARHAPRGFERIPPELGPREATEEERERDERNPHPRHRMHVAPEQPPAAVEPWPDHTRQPSPLSRPPEHEPGEHHHDRPAGGKLDEIRATVAHQQLPVKAEDLLHEAVAFTDAAENRQ